MKRSAGILYPIFSLPSPYGIGCFSKEAYEFIDFLKQAGQSYWQILPVGPTGFGDSPYQPLSAFAGNPYFIDLVQLIEQGWLSCDEVNQEDWGDDPERVDYAKIYHARNDVLAKAYGRFKEDHGSDLKEYAEFSLKEKDWLDDYCLYRILKQIHNGKSWQDWDDAYKTRKPEALKEIKEKYSDDLHFYAFEQYVFMEQWNKLHNYANEKGIHIIGDMPFYVSLDSADCWAHPEVFQMDKALKPAYVAGCAPDAFSEKGQLWGNPVYDWDYLKKHQYNWWIERIKRNLKFYSSIRIDHFDGFCSYYAVPYGEETAEHGTSEKGPGLDFFNEVKKELGDVNLIAEDLGEVTRETRKLLKDTGIPGMNILEYAFTSWNSIYLPYKHVRNSVIYTGTHDNATVREWLDTLDEGTINYVRRYLNSMHTDYGALTWDFIREAYRSVSDLCVIPIQDYLVKGSEARLNQPGTSQGNWQWRVLPGFLSDELAVSIHDLAAVYGRIPSENN